MSDSTYIGKYGSLRAMSTSLLGQQFYEQASGKQPEEILKMLSETRYRKELDELSQLYQMPDLFEAVINSTLARSIREAFSAMPPLARPFITAYISKWDIENIKIILSSKVMGYEIKDTDNLMLAAKNPIGILGGSISRSEYSSMLAQKDVNAVVNYLAKFRYGTVMMSKIDDYVREGTLSSMFAELDNNYYSELKAMFRFYKGDEGNVYEYIIDMIDLANVLNAAKASLSDMHDMQEYMIKGGNIAYAQIMEAINGKASPAVMRLAMENSQECISKHIKSGNLYALEASLKRSMYSRFMPSFIGSSASLSYIMSYILRLEAERDMLMALLLKGYYGINADFAMYTIESKAIKNGS